MNAARTHRFYVDQLPAPGDNASQVQLPPGEAHHAANVLRLAMAAPVELFDGRGGRAAGRIESVKRGEVVVAVERSLPASTRDGPLVHLAVPKGKRLDWLLEKATELGAASLTPVIFRRSVAGTDSLPPAKLERWLGHCIAAAKQCGLDFLPAIAQPVRLSELLAASAPRLALLGCCQDDATPIAAALARRQSGQDVLVLVGPEGGTTDDEHQAARDAGFIPVKLGHTTLRTETAAISLLAAATATLAAAEQRSK